MKDTDYVAPEEQRTRLVSVHQRKPDGSLEPQPIETPFTPEFRSGGGGLFSTAPDYLTFTRMLLHEGSLNGTRAGVPGSAGEFMWAGYAGTYFWVDPKEELGVIFMTQAPSPIRAYYRRLMKQLVAQAIVD